MKGTMKQKFVIAVVAGLLAAGPAMAMEPEKKPAKVPISDINQEITIAPARIVTPAQQEILSNAAVATLRHIADARGYIHAKKPEEAKKALKKAEDLINIIKAGRPMIKIKDHIWVAKKHLDYESTKEVGADLIPISADLSDIEDFVPVIQARKHLNKAKESLKKGDKKSAKEELTAVAEAITYDEIDLPLSETEHQVVLAQKALDQNKLTDADKALKAAEDGVQFFSVAIEGPLAKAQNSYAQATKDYAAKKYDATKTDLKKAEDWIKRAGQSSDKKIRQAADKLEKSIKNLEKKL